MKKLIYLILFVLVIGLTCCSDNDNPKNEPSTVRMQFYSYTKFTPTSTDDKVNSSFFLFKADNGEEFMEEIHINSSGEYIDYTKINCEMVTLLKNNEFALSDGTKVKPISINGSYSIDLLVDYKDLNKWSSTSDNAVDIPLGKYYIVCLLKTASGWANQGKYSGKYIEVSTKMSEADKTIKISFPHDIHRKGFVDWVTTNWEYN